MSNHGPDARWHDYLKALPQYLMPGHLLSRLMYAFTRVRYAPVKNRFIDWFIGRFRVEMSEAVDTAPHDYPHFNAFFTRALRADARPVADGPGQVACPVDGTVSQAGGIRYGYIFQAKGRRFTLEQLLGGSAQRAAPFADGAFATIYLSPRDYHRIHMPIAGTLREMVHIPGRLFSVSPATTRVIPGLFARNERVAAIFDTELGPMAVVMVGAVFVGGIETVWHGPVTPPAGRIVKRWTYEPQSAPRLLRGDELGRFNMGSTVVLLFGAEAVQWAQEARPEAKVKMGQLLGFPPPPAEGETPSAD